MNTYDAAIAGGGIIGASIALELAEAGLKVALYDAREPGREASWASAGMISPAPETAAMISFMPLSMASVALYPQFIETIEKLADVSVGYRQDGALDVILDDDPKEELSTIIAMQHGVGLRAEALNGEKARQLEPALTEEVRAAVFRPEEASLDARILTQGALRAARSKGAQVFANNGAKAIWKEGARCKGLLLENGKVQAKWTIIAAGCFSARIEGVAPYAPVFPAKGQMAGLRAQEVQLKRVLWLEHTYLVPRNDGRIIAGSTIERTGFDHQVTAGGISKILSGALRLVPGLASARIEETWAGLRPDSPDHLPILGPTDVEGLLMATGHFRSGILLAPVTARLIRDWVVKQAVKVSWDRYSPMRFLEASKTHGG
jgi:glycine oxidase